MYVRNDRILTMSLLRRKRRQNRVNAIVTPATRTTRLVLAPSLERGLRLRPVQSILKLRDKIRTERIEPRPITVRLRRNILPYGYRRLPTIRRADRLVVQDNKIGLISVGDYGKLQVDLPHDHPVCRERRERREVMFATHKAGKGGQKKPRQPELIVRCK